MSGINDGQRVNAANSNAAWLAKNGDDTAVGIVTLNNSDPASGSSVPNVQGAINNSKTFTGQTNTLDTTPTYSSTNYASGSLETAVGALDAQVKTNADNISTIQGDITTLDGRVDALETNIEYETGSVDRTLTVNSEYVQIMTGSSNRIITLPVTTTLTVGWSVFVKNDSTGVLELRTSGVDPLVYLQPNQAATAICTTASGTTYTSWSTTVFDAIQNIKSTATAAGTTALDWEDSARTQIFTGSTTQTITLPLSTAIVNGYNYVGESYYILNKSTGALTVNGYDNALVKTIPAGAGFQFMLAQTGSVATNWVVIAGASSTFSDSDFTIQDNSDNKKKLQFQASSIATATTRTFSFPDVDSEVIVSSGAQTVSGNKTFSGAVVVRDNNFTIEDDSDNTKKAQFQLSGITTATTRTYTLPNLNGELAVYTAPTIQRFTSGSGTYTTPANVKYLMVEIVGGGAGGAGSGSSNSGGTGTAGGNTTFGTSLLTANGGAVATVSGGNYAGGAGGTATVAGAATEMAAIRGGGGGSGALNNSTGTVSTAGGMGGVSAFGGAGAGANTAGGGAAATNSGSGGGGGGSTSTASVGSGGGGGSGGYVKALISSPSATYSYAVGAAGSGGTAGTSGATGGAGSAGLIIVTEYYN